MTVSCFQRILQHFLNLISTLFFFLRYAIKATTTKVAILSRLGSYDVCDYQTETRRRNNQVVCFVNITAQINLWRIES